MLNGTPSLMHDFELFLLLLILAAFGSFAAMLASVSAGYTRWRDGHPARTAAEPPRTRPAAAVARQHA